MKGIVYKKSNRKMYQGGGFIGSTADTLLDTGLDLASAIPGFGAIASGVKVGKQLLGGLGLFGKTADEVQADKIAKQQEEIRKEAERKATAVKDQAELKTYPTNGVQVTGFYKKGGKPRVSNAIYEVEKDEVVQGTDVQLEEGTKVASDIIKVGGEKHENGGTEGKGGERVYSDSIKISNDLLTALNKAGIKINENATYADVATKLGSVKSKFENQGVDNIDKSTNSEMTDRVNSLLDLTFNTQEMSKQPTTNQPMYRKGGVLPKYEDGATIDLRPKRQGFEQSLEEKMKFSLPMEENPQIEYPTELGGKPAVSDNKLMDIIGEENKPAMTIANPNAKLSSGTGSKISNFIKDNQGQLLNVGNYLLNRRTINSIKTDIKPTLNPAPAYNYVDRSGKAKQDLNTAFNTASQGVEMSSSQSTASNKAALFAERISKLNDINQAENQRKDSYDDNFNNRLLATSVGNNATINQNNVDNLNRYNSKVGYQLNNRNALMQGVMANDAVNRQEKMDLLKLAIEKYKDGDRGVFDAMVNDKSVMDLLTSLGIKIPNANKDKNG